MGERIGRQFGNPRGLTGRIVTFVMNRMNTALYDAISEEAGNGTEVLDIGFGNGYMLRRLLRTTDSKFWGIDISEDMVKLAGKKNKASVKEGRLTLTKASVNDIPFEKEFDLVYTINTVYFWDDLRGGLAEIHSKLKEGGVFINACYTKQMLDQLRSADHYRKYSEEELSEAAESVGFEAGIIPVEEGRSFCLKATKRTG